MNSDFINQLITLYRQQPRSINDLPYTDEMLTIAIAIKQSNSSQDIREIERWCYITLVRMRRNPKRYDFPIKIGDID